MIEDPRTVAPPEPGTFPVRRFSRIVFGLGMLTCFACGAYLFIEIGPESPIRASILFGLYLFFAYGLYSVLSTNKSFYRLDRKGIALLVHDGQKTEIAWRDLRALEEDERVQNISGFTVRTRTLIFIGPRRRRIEVDAITPDFDAIAELARSFCRVYGREGVLDGSWSEDEDD